MRALLDAAARLFAEQSFARTTVEQIATEANVAVGTIYGNFGDKRGLYLAAVERAVELNEQYVLPVYEQGLSPAEEIAAAGGAYVRFYRDHPGQFRLLALPTLEPGDETGGEAAEAIKRRVDRMIERLARAIEEATAEGTVRDVPPLPAARVLVASLNGAVALNLLPGTMRVEGDELDEVVRTTFRLLAEGLAADPWRAPGGELSREAEEQIRDLTEG
jgi:AcrR family transcriptional regulator